MRRRKGFTLVELLVVIGIVAVLIAFLFPVLSKARRQATQVACLSNLRQLGVGLLSYAHASRGWFPAPAMALLPYEEDWVHWQAGRDSAQGSIAPFLGRDLRVLACPLGPADGRSEEAYPFSYSVNIYFTGRGGGVHRFDPYYGGEGPCTVGKVVNPSQKILAIDEDPTGVNDGAWWPIGTDNAIAPRRYSSISIRHDGTGPEHGGNPMSELEVFHYPRFGRRRGNAVFADGHGEMIERSKVKTHPYCDPQSREPPY